MLLGPPGSSLAATLFFQLIVPGMNAGASSLLLTRAWVNGLRSAVIPLLLLRSWTAWCTTHT